VTPAYQVQTFHEAYEITMQHIGAAPMLKADIIDE